MQVKIDFERCKGCGLCVNACPKKVLCIGDKSNKGGYFVARVDKPEQCIGCCACAYMCPDSCVEVE
ncbi:MAG: 4Fe-4S binding protein [Clostridia bacterium]|nr:4Fe-4S binding protein [Clostridia bacterium]MDD3832114.1 4Fe-4S binding protein [Clostridia bacterium]